MTPAEVARRRWVAQEIGRDAVRDAATLDGTPFTGRGLAPKFGEIYAAIQALANLIDDLYAQAHPGVDPEEDPR